MKVDITMPEQEADSVPIPATQALQSSAGDIAIDISQVLQANQALLKNMARKMESLENRLQSLQGTISDQVRQLEARLPEQLMLMAPPQRVEPWNPEFPKLDEDYFAGFSWIERVFFPAKLRRAGVED